MDTEAIPCTTDDLFLTLGTARAPLLIDVRRRPAFEADPHLAAGATWRDPFAVGEWERFLPRHRPLVAYCVHGHEISRNASAELRALGLDVRYLVGGFERWRAAGLPTVKARERHAIPSDPGAPSQWVTRERPKIDRLDDFGIRDAALERLAAIVRGADTGRLDLAAECAGLLAISRGLGRIHPEDHILLAQGMGLYDALYAECRGAPE